MFGDEVTPTRLGREWTRFFRVRTEEWGSFFRHSLAACGLHDLGKANDGFQAAIRHSGEQVLRHEHLSALLLSLPVLRDWLSSGGLDPDLITAAVAGHHLKAWSDAVPPGDGRFYPALGERLSAADSIVVLSKDPQFLRLLNDVAQRLRVSEWCGEVPEYWSFGRGGQSIPEIRGTLHRRFRRLKRELSQEPPSPRARLFVAVKAAVVAADTAGSGLPRERHDIREWLQETFGTPPLTANDIDSRVIQPRVAALKQQLGIQHTEPFPWQGFQTAAASLPERALVLAGCGAGKTLAAWRWIEARLKARPAAKALFLYPTRATATEGFRDYVSFAPESDAALLSGTAGYELAGMFDNPADTRYGRHFEPEERLYALGFWRKRVFSATVDQFLGFLQQVYRSVCLLPVLADSVVVIDEVHSFDAGLWSALRHFLKVFDLPVLCMTASLPIGRRRELEQLGLQVFPEQGDEFEDLARRAQLSRYRVHTLDSAGQAKSEAQRSLAVGKRVLWVVNTVDRCQDLARELGTLCYHSRFTLADRQAHHKEVIAAFQRGGTDGVLAITTQVCEMSLDLDAQVLISETAPIPSLIQRMGRCNRHADRQSDLGQVFLYQPERTAPYEADDLAHVEEFVQDLTGAPISQERLQELLETYTQDQARDGERLVGFLRDGPWARGGAESLRDGDDYHVQAVLDPEEVLRLRRHHQPIDGLTIPVPRRFATYDPRLGAWPQVADPSHYDSRYGFFREPIEEGRS
jgi:CRISPR-associated endonuclease/helicase Cas3